MTKHISPTYKERAKRNVWFRENGVLKLRVGKVSATLCSSRLCLCSSPTIPDVAHTPQSDSFSA